MSLHSLKQGTESIKVGVCETRILIYGDFHTLPNEPIVDIVQEQIQRNAINYITIKDYNALVSQIRQIKFILLLLILYMLIGHGSVMVQLVSQ